MRSTGPTKKEITKHLFQLSLLYRTDCAESWQNIDQIGDFFARPIKLCEKYLTLSEPFNNQYLNYTRDDLPIVTKISDIVERIAAIAERAIIDNGGKKMVQNGKVVYLVKCDF